MFSHLSRTFLNQKIRAIWDTNENKWWYSSSDVLSSLIYSSNPRIYWNTLKKRHPELASFSKQAKLYSSDNKKYFTDVIDETGVRQLSILVRSKNNIAFQTWLNGSLDPIDKQSKRKAYELYKANLFDKSEIGKTIP